MDKMREEIVCPPSGQGPPQESSMASQASHSVAPPELPRIPIRFARPMGETFKDMQRNAQQSELYKHGDMMLVWVNEGDFIMNPVVQFTPTRVSDEHLKGEDAHASECAACQRGGDSQTPDPTPETSGTEAKPVAYLLNHPEYGEAGFSFHPLTEADKKAGFTERPLYASPLPVTEEIAGLVEKLKTHARTTIIRGYEVVFLEAAQALLSLQQKVKELEEERDGVAQLLTQVNEQLWKAVRRAQTAEAALTASQAQAEALKREVERKNKALERIADTDILYPPHDPGDYSPPKGRDGPCRKIALRALSSENASATQEDGRHGSL